MSRKIILFTSFSIFCFLSGRIATAQEFEKPSFEQATFINIGKIETYLPRNPAATVPQDSQELYNQILRQLVTPDTPQDFKDFIQNVFFDPDTQIIDSIPPYFGIHHGGGTTLDENRKKLLVQQGTQFLADPEHQELLNKIKDAFGVDPALLASLVGVETDYGTYTGSFPVFNTLYTIALEVPSHSTWAQEQLAVFIKLCFQQHWDAHGANEVKGSYAGAFGFYQFIPTAFDSDALDYDGDGLKSYDQWPDVFASMAHYLEKSGYEKGSVDFSEGSPNWKAIFAYNHSDSYVELVIALRKDILDAQNQASRSLFIR